MVSDSWKRVVLVLSVVAGPALASVLDPESVLAEPPPESSASPAEIKEHREQAAEHARLAREHAAESLEHRRAELRAKWDELHDSAREQGAVVREELKEARVSAREHLKEAGEQLKAAGQAAHEQLKGAREAVHEGLISGRAELESAAAKLNQELSIMRERANQARMRVWAQWKLKLHSREAIDARIQNEFEKHARRQAKLERIAALAREEADTKTLDRTAKLQAAEAERHDQRMKRLTADQQAAHKDEARP